MPVAESVTPRRICLIRQVIVFRDKFSYYHIKGWGLKPPIKVRAHTSNKSCEVTTHIKVRAHTPIKVNLGRVWQAADAVAFPLY